MSLALYVSNSYVRRIYYAHCKSDITRGERRDEVGCTLVGLMATQYRPYWGKHSKGKVDKVNEEQGSR